MCNHEAPTHEVTANVVNTTPTYANNCKKNSVLTNITGVIKHGLLIITTFLFVIPNDVFVITKVVFVITTHSL